MFFTDEYKKYLKSDVWKAKREQAFNHYGRSCMLCGSYDKLEVHHRHYKNIMNESINDLTIICDKCHAIFHETKREYDKKPIVKNKPHSNIIDRRNHEKNKFKLLTKDGMIRKGTKCPFINVCMGKNDSNCYKECSENKYCKKTMQYDTEGVPQYTKEEIKSISQQYDYRKSMYAEVVEKASDYINKKKRIKK